MTKLGIARIVGECTLGGGCVAGGVEAGRVGVKVKKATEDLETKNKNLSSEKSKVDSELKETKRQLEELKKRNENLKEAVKYGAQHYNVINGMTNKSVDEIKKHARDAKHGIKNILEKDSVNENLSNEMTST